ncbi:pirin [Sulfobacillus thermotolerans]|uniref:Pirin n=1 Tax=Sulfobacillus thermotolerans TaxID=338644 RepID=A0ABM6RT36_9FIRM|nr:pirin [Sulfobacillus thermotolerans]
MPAREPENIMVLPRLREPDAALRDKNVVVVSHAPRQLEGAGFPVRRPFPSQAISWTMSDPFLLLDHMGAVEYAPGEAKGAPWHPHRGFETVTYMMDGAFRHRDSNGGGGLITNGDTQWMTAGAGILHDEMPPDELVRTGGLFHGVQLWVNLPRRLKMTPPRYQSISADKVLLLASSDGTAIIRLIAGLLGSFQGPGVTWTPITVAHVSVTANAQFRTPWPASYNAMAYILAGQGRVGADDAPVAEGDGIVFGPGDTVRIRANAQQDAPTPRLELLLLGGEPIREPIFSYGPFVMNTRSEILQAIEDFQSGRMGHIPASQLFGD